MSALTAARNTLQRTDELMDFPLKGGVVCHAGGIAVLNGGYLAPATAATGLVCVGRIDATVDNSAGGDGAVSGAVTAGVFRYGNSAAGDAIAQADVGQDCYLVDDQTVAKTSATNTRSRAGRVTAVDALGVWVLMGLGL